MQPARERDKLEVLFLSQGGERVGWPWREGWPSLELALSCSYGRGRKMLSKAASLHYSFGKGFKARWILGKNIQCFPFGKVLSLAADFNLLFWELY